ARGPAELGPPFGQVDGAVQVRAGGVHTPTRRDRVQSGWGGGVQGPVPPGDGCRQGAGPGGLVVAGKDVVDVGAAVAVMGDSSAAQTALEVGGPQARPLISC